MSVSRLEATRSDLKNKRTRNYVKFKIMHEFAVKF